MSMANFCNPYFKRHCWTFFLSSQSDLLQLYTFCFTYLHQNQQVGFLSRISWLIQCHESKLAPRRGNSDQRRNKPNFKLLLLSRLNGKVWWSKNYLFNKNKLKFKWVKESSLKPRFLLTLDLGRTYEKFFRFSNVSIGWSSRNYIQLWK